MKETEKIFESDHTGKELPPDKIRPLALAYLGDTVLDLYVRTKLVTETTLHPKEMHQAASHIVNAGAQAKMVKYLMDDLTEEEKEVFRKARNQHSGTLPKNQSPIDYKWATGLEALLGYLYLKGEKDRLSELIRKGFEALDSDSGPKGKENHE